MKVAFHDQLTICLGPSILLKINTGNHLTCEKMLISHGSHCLLGNLINILICLFGALEGLSPQDNILFGMAKRCSFFGKVLGRKTDQF